MDATGPYNAQITRAITDHLKHELRDYSIATRIAPNNIILTDSVITRYRVATSNNDNNIVHIDNHILRVYEISVHDAVRVTHYQGTKPIQDYSIDLRDPNMLDGLTNYLKNDFKARRDQITKEQRRTQ